MSTLIASPWDRLAAAKKRASKDRYWHRWHNNLQTRARPFQRVFSKYLLSEKARFIPIIRRLAPFHQLAAATLDQTEASLEVVQKLSIDEYIQQMIDTLRAAGDDFAADEYAALGFDYTGLPDSVSEWLDSYTPKIVDDIGRTSLDAVMEDIKDGIAEGEALPDIEDRINQTYSDWERSRVPFIARTEVGRIASMAQQATLHQGEELLTENEVIVQTWLTARDDRVRDSHQELEGEQQPLDEEFSNGLLFPRDPDGPPEEVINCRCTLLAEVQQKEE